MSTGLPAALRDAIARFAQDVAPKDLASRAASLTEYYRGGTGSATAIRDDRDVAAYLTTRLPATYAAMAAALRAVKDRAPHFTPARLLDVGSGPGTASWAASDIWPLESITMLDRNPHLLAAARVLAQSNESLARAEVVAADLNHYPRKADASLFLPSPLVGEGVGALRSSARPTEGGAVSARSDGAGEKAFLQQYDLVLAGYTFAELTAQARERTLAHLWNLCRGILVIVEPGTPKGFATILACRTQLLAAGARIVAPCPGAHPCPITAPDWCHFAERLPRSRAHMRAKDASVPFEDEKFSYLAVARGGVDLSPIAARIIAPPLLSKPGVRLRLCTPTGVADRVVLKRDKPAYKAISRKTWGDAL